MRCPLFFEFGWEFRSFEIAVLKNIYRIKRDGDVAALPNVKVWDMFD